MASSNPNQSLKFEFGARHVLEGIEVAVGHMTKGQTVEATIPSLYAYGHQGYPPRIPPRATLIFKIELVDILSVTKDTTEPSDSS